MTATIALPIETVETDQPAAPRVCPLAPNAGEGGCQHPSGSCKPEGCSAC